MINCLLVDDEPYALELLCKYIADFKDMEVVASCRSVQEAIPVLQAERIDLLFLDVKMPKITGMEFLETVKHLPEVVLTTAYREYAIQAYDFGVLDYLLKPISFMRFAKAVDRFKETRNNVEEPDAMKRPVVFKSGFEYHKITPAEIRYIQSIKEYVSIVCNNNKYLVRSSMSDILSRLPADEFIQVHKSYIVPIAGIQSVAQAEVILTGDCKLPIGRSFGKILRSRLAEGL